ncbi:AMP-binding protein [Streptomyces sp. NPDC002779]|uniref:AMP-binding protein n=1 Tax=Streptomyces sp. NPDC002779 TaxID=3364664 RepID=UPI0036910E00
MSIHDPRASRAFRAARDLLLSHYGDPETARKAFTWPELTCFNWAFDWFDVIAEGNRSTALRLVGPTPEDDEAVSFEELSRRSDQVAHWLEECGVRRGDRILLALPNCRPLWEAMLAAIKLGAVVVPTYTTATTADLADRLDRAEVRHVLADAALTERFAGLPGSWTRMAVGGPVPGWLTYEESWTADRSRYEPQALTRADEPLFVYFTSGTTSRAKMVGHTHTSYPVGHLSGMFWNGVRPGDAHLNISAPGWAKHAWSSFFVPWNAEATIVALTGTQPEPRHILQALRTRGVTSFCAPPTVWRGLLATGLGPPSPWLREATCAGEPLEPALTERVAAAWGVRLRDGYGQTETTAQLGQAPGSDPEPGTMGRPLPGYEVVVVDPASDRPVEVGGTGELCLDLTHRPAGLMSGYLDDVSRTAKVFAGDRYRTGDLVTVEAGGTLRYAGRNDDMFKSYDHRISPLELERVLLRHPCVAEAAVVPVPDDMGLWIPKAYVVLAPGTLGGAPGRDLGLAEVARALFDFASVELPPEKWVKVVEFASRLPVTVSGKVRRAALREAGSLGGREFHLPAS